MKYLSRLKDQALLRQLKNSGAVEIKGPKWCGKTTTAKRYAASFINMDVPANRDRFALAPDSVMFGDFPRLVDEWQDEPGTWDAARRIIDDRGKPGLYIFTGSATPGQEPSHSGVGRFSELRMRTMSLYEMGRSDGTVSLAALFKHRKLEPQTSSLDYGGTIDIICKGGWPGTVHASVNKSMQIATDYINNVIRHDLKKTTGVEHDPVKFRLFLKSLARNTGTPARIATIVNDISQSEGVAISDKTIDSYFTALRKIYLLEEISGFTKNLRSKSRMRTSPIRYFTDTSLAVAALEITRKMLFEDPRTAGFLFESVCLHDLLIYAEALDGKVYQYHDDNGFEVDMILKLKNGKWAAIECKLGTQNHDEAAEKLLDLRAKAKERGDAPSFLMIVTATSGVSAKRKDGVYVVALDNLKP